MAGVRWRALRCRADANLLSQGLPAPQEADFGPADVPFREGPAPRVRPRKALEAKIFVPPRAADDPGTGTPEIDDLPGYPTKA